MTNRTDGEDLLKERVDQAAVETHPKNYTELKEAYQQQYGVTWKSEIINSITAERRQTSPNYQRSSAQRQVNRYEAWLKGEHTKEARNPAKPAGAMKTALVDIGKRNPLKDAPPNGFTVTVSGKQGSGRKERTRTFSQKMGHDRAKDFVQNPSLADLFAQMYPKEPDIADLFFGDDSASLNNVSITVA